MRQQNANIEGSHGSHKVVKRARIEEPSEDLKVTYKATRWERRRSRGLAREYLTLFVTSMKTNLTGICAGKLPGKAQDASLEATVETETENITANSAGEAETSRAEEIAEGDMDETGQEEVSEAQPLTTSLQTPRDGRDREPLSQVSPVTNTHDIAMMNVHESEVEDVQLQPDSPPAYDAQSGAKDVDPVEISPIEGEEAFNLISVDTFSIQVSPSKIALENQSTPTVLEATTNHMAGGMNLTDAPKSVDVGTDMQSTSPAKTPDVQIEIPISQLANSRDNEIDSPAKSSPMKEHKPVSTAVFSPKDDVEVTADLNSIAEELLKPPVSPISPPTSPATVDDTFRFRITETDSPTKAPVQSQEDTQYDSPSKQQVSSQPMSPKGVEGLQIVTPMKAAADDESPEPDPDQTDMTADFTADFTSQFDDDKDRLKAFILRVGQEKANKAANITRRESLQNRRDSDAIRRALASPRPALEEKDANVPSPTRDSSVVDISKVLESAISDVEDRDLSSQTNITAPGGNDDETATTSPSLRRSTRKQSRIPQLPSATAPAQQRTPKKISVRRTDGNDTLVLAQKKEAQELANLTRANTRKNKGGAIAPTMRLAQLVAENLANLNVPVPVLQAASPSGEQRDQQPEADRKEQSTGRRKSVRWNEEKLTSFSLAPVFAEDANTSKAQTSSTQSLGSGQAKKSSTSRVRRLKGLGAANGTPAKGLLASTLLPDEIAEQKEKDDAEKGENEEKEKKRKVKESTTNRSKLAKANEKKSRLVPPKTLDLKPSVTSVTGTMSVVSEGKENASVGKLVSPKKTTGVPTAPAARGMIPVPAGTTTNGFAASGNAVDGSMAAQPARKRVRKM